MNIKTAEILCKLNTKFYRENCDSFAETRHAPWPGWKRALKLIQKDRGALFERLSVFDLACGNLRFEAFLKEELPQTALDIYAVDNCSELIPLDSRECFQNLDIMQALLSGVSINDQVEAPSCDLSVSFGFMHHVPGTQLREEVLKSLVRQTRRGGYVGVSFWQFLNNDELKQKALITHEAALKSYSELDLDAGDYLLGWKNISSVYRYCHSFSEPEIDYFVRLIEEDTELIARYASDGRGDNLNTYLIFKVKG